MTAEPRGDLSEAEAAEAGPRLWLVATPIGNLEDMSFRAIRVLKEVDAIACEDTRVTRSLLEHFDIPAKQVFACHEHNEAASAAGIVKLIEDGKSVALVSDAGAPAVSDPGYRVVRAVLDAGLEVSAVPGPSAVLAALTVSGLPTDRFTFIGFGPRKPGKRKRWLEAFADDPSTIVLMESPQRLAETLADALAVLGDRRAAVALELTKKFERVHRGRLSELIERYAEPPRGEATVVVEGAKTRREKVNKYAPDGGKKAR
ncbi:16S rRNA (cytidine(1402)-2'-O)-methyltransferase [Marinicauda salina]|uniref:Ribosomal RNA small subunit methyltransferase I n=1 Tax=Marinicauda salina TaxID=2135793 RepID=A0A2U2BVU0_9PROT|nr:16S rRNA (cytidine(1402)-2'-O)-methyltransferase [Marinicauda salina]PWE18128.1 16S rRNA (cytidine(1402)-2'-O)-methyltransferase [Marinicauda salina]